MTALEQLTQLVYDHAHDTPTPTFSLVFNVDNYMPWCVLCSLLPEGTSRIAVSGSTLDEAVEKALAILR